MLYSHFPENGKTCSHGDVGEAAGSQVGFMLPEIHGRCCKILFCHHHSAKLCLKRGSKGFPCPSYNQRHTTKASSTWDPAGNGSQCKALPKSRYFNGAVKFFLFWQRLYLTTVYKFVLLLRIKQRQKSLSSCLHENFSLLSAFSYAFVRHLVCKNY